MEKLESKQELDQAMEWLDAERNEKASTAAIIFGVKLASIRKRQLHKHHQERNSRGTFNRHGGNNIILTEAQKQAVSWFNSE